MARPTVKIANGDLFLIKRDDLLLGLGLIARGKQKYTKLGYFFHPDVWQNYQRTGDLNICSKDAILVMIFSSLFIHTKTWPIVGKLENFERALWPVPIFTHFNDSLNIRYFRLYPDNDSFAQFEQVRVSEYPIIPKDSIIAEDGGAGSEFIEIRLARLQGIDSDSWPERQPIEFYLNLDKKNPSPIGVHKNP
jgi:hypothetical protein